MHGAAERHDAETATARSETPSADDWYADGERVSVVLRVDGAERRHHLFVRDHGEGRTTTFLHGFPTCSYDWALLDAALPAEGRRLFVDLLGFGDSDKPRIDYTMDLQLAALREIWAQKEVKETDLVVHDYAVSVAQELLARMAEGHHEGPKVRSIAFLNGGLFYDVYSPLPIQRFLHHPLTGPLVARFVTYPSFQRAMRHIEGDHPVDRAFLQDLWGAMLRRGGRRVYHRLSKYHAERRAHDARWTAALREASMPLVFLWGTKDPISGGMPEALATRVPAAHVTAWHDLGHYPHLEDAGRVATALGG